MNSAIQGVKKEMKNTIIMIFAVCLLVAGTASAEEEFNLKGKMLGSAYLGYTLGLGDPFGDESVTVGSSTYTASFKPGIGFGATFHYGVSPKIMIGGELGFQSYKVETEIPSGSVGSVSFGGGSASASSTETNFLGSALYALNYTDDQKALFLTAGAGIYGGASSDLGLNFGVVWRTMVSEKIGIMVMPRFHYVLADTALKMLQIAAGVQIPFGSK